MHTKQGKQGRLLCYDQWKSLFWSASRKNDLKICDSVQKLRQGDDYTTVCLLDYAYFKENYKLVAIDISKKKH